MKKTIIVLIMLITLLSCWKNTDEKTEGEGIDNPINVIPELKNQPDL